MRKLLLSATIGAAMLFAGPAAAVTHTLSLTAQDANPFEYQQDYGGFHFTQFSWGLSGFGDPIDVAQGDTIDATVTLATAFTVPASTGFTDYGLYLFGDALPVQDTGTGNGVFSLYLDGALIATLYGGSGTSGGIASGGALFPPDSGPLTFDSYTLLFDITDLATPITLDGATLTISVADRISAVPEAGTWAMMLIGFGGVGAALRRRRSASLGLA